MKTWEKVMKLESEYLQARQQLLTGQCQAVEIKIIKDTKKNAPKPSAKTSSQ